MKFFVFAAFIFAFLAPSPAQTEDKPRPHAFESMDKDGSGGVSLEEYKEVHASWLEEKFKKIDKNSDQMISKEELKSARMQQRKQMMKMKEKLKSETPASPSPTPPPPPAE